MTHRNCEWCGETFWARLNQRFCQLSCNQAWNNEAARRGRELLRQQQATTYAQLAAGALGDEAGGRFAVARPKPQMNEFREGPWPVPDWSHDPVGPEPPLGFDINEVPDLGFPEGQHND
jgi:hypothetical protein